ncbi:transposase domain-containing protein [Salmonella enterica subsp. enterica]|nr:transposase domain-containing protein [Salmonella enterica subsp. enterica]EIK6739244.1 transposase domain-containing protein [Salmonella enterica subsp. enterica serovar Aqua]HCM8923788.1 transposase domain-containing protein [Salmonella enterica subsp. enterica serovar Paratyphi B]
MYSLTEATSKLNGMNPEAYLWYVLSLLPDWLTNRVNELLLWNV